MNAVLKGTSDVSFQRSRKGSPDDREKIVSFPAPQQVIESRGGGPFRRLVPGLVTGASDVDHSLVITATVAGSVYHYSMLWSVLLCLPFLLAVFAVSARIGVETRQGLVDLLRTNYGQIFALLCAILIVAINMAMIVADLMA